MVTTPGGRTRMMMSGLHFICAGDIGDIDDTEYYTFSAEHAQSRETSRSRVTSNRRRFRGVTLR